MRDIRFSNDPSPWHTDAYVSLQRALARLMRPVYPGYELWAENYIEHIAAGIGPRALIGAWGKDPLVALTYKLHPTMPHIVEARNAVQAPRISKGLPVIPMVLGLLPHVAKEDFPGATMLMGDTKITNRPMIDMALASGWHIAGITTLVSRYGHNGVPDVVLMRPIEA